MTLLKITIILRRCSAEARANSDHLYSAAAAARITILLRNFWTRRFISFWSTVHSRHWVSAPAAIASCHRLAASTILAPISLLLRTNSTHRDNALACSACRKNPTAWRIFWACSHVSTKLENALDISRWTQNLSACFTWACMASFSCTSR